MALSDVFSAMKREGFVIRPLDLYLLSLNKEDNDRAIDVNAPSQVGTCMRARFYARTGEEPDANSVDARTRRIFDNGTYYHVRMQEYLKEAGLLLMDEVPVHNYEYNIQGHTDGILKLTAVEDAVLELKSINSKAFTDLKAPKPEHRKQGLVYIFCLEERRKFLQSKYSTRADFDRSLPIRKVQYKKLYQHLKGGRKFTREQKIAFQVSLHIKMDSILYDLKKPITKAIFLYENKDNQELKEYCVSTTEAASKNIMKEILEEYSTLNDYVSSGELPPREGRNKSDSLCRWCNYKSACWIV